MGLGFMKWPLRSSFGGSAEQEAPSTIKIIHPWLDALVEHPPTPDESVDEFKMYFDSLEEAVRARRHVPIGPSGRVRTSAPLYTFEDEAVSDKVEGIFRAVFEHEDWPEQDREKFDAVWKSVPHSLMKASFRGEEHKYETPATISRAAFSAHGKTEGQISSGEVVQLDDYRSSPQPTPPDDGGAAALVAEAH